MFRKLGGMAVIATFLAIPLCIIWFDPHVDQISTAQSFCPHKMLTGLPCPVCGMIKSMVALYQGHIKESIQAHLWGPLITLGMGVAFFWLGWEVVRRKEFKPALLYNIKWAYAVAILFGGYHLVRLIVFIATHSWDAILRESIWR